MNYQSNDVIQRARESRCIYGGGDRAQAEGYEKKETREKIPIKLTAETADVARLSTARVSASA